MASKSKSKVKSYARRTKKGISRVVGHDRKSNKSKRNRNIAIGVGVGTTILALGLGAKHLAKKKGLKSPNAQDVSFTPSPSPRPKPLTPSTPRVPQSQNVGKPSPLPSPSPKSKIETPSATVAEVRQTTQSVVDKAKEIKADKSFTSNLRDATMAAKQDAVQSAKVTIVDESKTKLNKRAANSLKVMDRQNMLMQVEGEDLMRPYFGANAKMNSNRLLRKKNAKRLADAARDLRSRGMYS